MRWLTPLKSLKISKKILWHMLCVTVLFSERHVAYRIYTLIIYIFISPNTRHVVSLLTGWFIDRYALILRRNMLHQQLSRINPLCMGYEGHTNMLSVKQGSSLWINSQLCRYFYRLLVDCWFRRFPLIPPT